MDMTDHTGDPAMDVVVAGVRFRSPIGLAAIGGGSHFGKPDADPELEEDVQLQFLLVEAVPAASYKLSI